MMALFLVSAINQRQMRRKLIKQRLSKLRVKVAELEDLAASIENLTASREIALVVHEHIVDTLDGMLKLSPDSQTLAIAKEASLSRINDLSDPDFQPQLMRAMPSDAQIAKAQYGLNEVGRIIRLRQAAGKMELAVMTNYVEQLAWAHLMVAVVSLTIQGHRAVNGGNVLRAYSYYKKALQKAMDSPIREERKHQLIKELSEIINNKRKSISETLMPECDENPV